MSIVRNLAVLACALLVPAANASADETGTAEPASGDERVIHNDRHAVQNKKVTLEGEENVVRSGPGEGFAIVGVYRQGKEFPIIAKSGEWFDIRLSDNRTGWIHSSLVKESDDFSILEFKPNPKLYSRVGSFILTGYTGAYAFDRKSNSLVAGGRLGYYVLSFLSLEGGVAWTHISRPREIVESLFDLSLEGEEFHMLFYHMNASIELLPGRQMVPFVTGGVGSTIMLGESESSINFGAGTTLYLSKKMAMRWEFRNYQFRSGNEAARRLNNNVEFSIGTSLLF